MKKRLDALQGKLTKKLENVLCELRTTPKVATRETPFGLVYDSEALAPIEIVMVSHGINHFEATANDEQRRLELDIVDETDGRLSNYKGRFVSPQHDITKYDYRLTRFSCGEGMEKK